jgi:hypothetical protein
MRVGNGTGDGGLGTGDWGLGTGDWGLGKYAIFDEAIKIKGCIIGEFRLRLSCLKIGYIILAIAVIISYPVGFLLLFLPC